VAEGARLESVFTRKGNQGSNPCLSAILGTPECQSLETALKKLSCPLGLSATADFLSCPVLKPPLVPVQGRVESPLGSRLKPWS
jgi:hypothetical protein